MHIEKWTLWDPLECSSGKYFIEKILYDAEGFKLLLFRKSDSKKIQFDFGHSVLVCSDVNESYRLNTLSVISDLSETFFKVENSGFLEWFSKESGNSFEGVQLIHYAFVEYDSIIDVIATADPLARWV